MTYSLILQMKIEITIEKIDKGGKIMTHSLNLQLKIEISLSTNVEKIFTTVHNRRKNNNSKMKGG